MWVFCLQVVLSLYPSCRYGNSREEAAAESHAGGGAVMGGGGGLEAIIGEGWKGHVLCTLSLLACSGNVVGSSPAALQAFVTLRARSPNLPPRKGAFGFPVLSL